MKNIKKLIFYYINKKYEKKYYIKKEIKKNIFFNGFLLEKEQFFTPLRCFLL